MTHLLKRAPARGMPWLDRAWLAATLCALLAACGGSGSGASDPPPTAAPLGNPVTQTVGTAGGTVQATTLDAKVKLVFPAGALAADTAVTITPVTPAAGDVVSVKLRPAGVFFAKPVTVVLEYPPGKAPAATARLRLRLGGADSYIGTTVDSAARTVTATLDTFGGSTVQVLAAPPQERARALSLRRLDIPADGDGTLSASDLSTVAQAVANARARLSRLLEAGLFDDALSLQLGIADLLQRTGEDGYIAEAVPFLQGAHDTACTARAAAIAASQTAPIASAGAYLPLAEKIMYWEMVSQRLGGQPCSGSSADDAVHALVAREMAFLRQRLPAATTPAEFGPPASDVKGGRKLQAQAGALQTAALPTPALSTAADGIKSAVQTELLDPAMQPAREAAWTAARTGGTLAHYPVLVEAFGGAGPLAQDAQFVRTRIAVASSDSSGNPVGDATLGFSTVPELPADPTRSATVQVRSGGMLALSGNVATLECAAAGAETLQVTFENVQVRSVSGSGGNLLAGALASLTPAGLLQAAGLPDTDTGTHPLVIKRTSPCSAALGITDDVIGTVMVDFGAPVMSFEGSASVWTTADPYVQGPGGLTCCAPPCTWAGDRPDPAIAFLDWNLSFSSTCGVFSTTLVPRLADSRNFTVQSEFASTDNRAELTVGVSGRALVAGTVTFAVNPSWMRNATCNHRSQALAHVFVGAFIQIFQPGASSRIDRNVATSLCPLPNSGVSFLYTSDLSSSVSVSVAAGTAFSVALTIGARDLNGAANTVQGSGTVFTVHFDPAH